MIKSLAKYSLIVVVTIFLQGLALSRHQRIALDNVGGCTIEYIASGSTAETMPFVRSCLNRDLEYRILGTLLFSDGSFILED